MEHLIEDRAEEILEQYDGKIFNGHRVLSEAGLIEDIRTGLLIAFTIAQFIAALLAYTDDLEEFTPSDMLVVVSALATNE